MVSNKFRKFFTNDNIITFRISIFEYKLDVDPSNHHLVVPLSFVWNPESLSERKKKTKENDFLIFGFIVKI